jgi:hypothetical protein
MQTIQLDKKNLKRIHLKALVLWWFIKHLTKYLFEKTKKKLHKFFSNRNTQEQIKFSTNFSGKIKLGPNYFPLLGLPLVGIGIITLDPTFAILFY